MPDEDFKQKICEDLEQFNSSLNKKPISSTDYRESIINFLYQQSAAHNLKAKKSFNLPDMSDAKGTLDIVWYLDTTPIVAFKIDKAFRHRSIKKLLELDVFYRFWIYYGDNQTHPKQFLSQFENNDRITLVKLHASLMTSKRVSKRYYQTAISQPDEPSSPDEDDRESISYQIALTLLQKYSAKRDIENEESWLIKNIPNGPQMIRGIAGSGKTLIICQKAAYMHAQHPDWKIAVLYFTRTLKEYLSALIQDYTYLNGIDWDSEDKQSNLQVIRFWGSDESDGFLSSIRKLQNIGKPKRENGRTVMEEFAFNCIDVLEHCEVKPQYDVIFIDEGQDIVTDKDEYRYKNRQAAYWLAYQSLKSFNPSRPELRRLIWAFDEYQSLNSMKVPHTREIFGDDEVFRNIMKGKGRSIIMDRCYRTPPQILMAAHAIGMGLYDRMGMSSGPTTKKGWEDLGYVVNGAFTIGNRIEIFRPISASPHPLSEVWKKPFVKLNTFSNPYEEYESLAKAIQRNLNNDGLRPSDILIISLRQETHQAHLKEISKSLTENGIKENYISTCSELGKQDIGKKPDQFSISEAVTISGTFRAKGNEANMVYIVGLDEVAKEYTDIEKSIMARNNLFVAMTRSKAWANISGIGNMALYSEFQLILDDINQYRKLKFIYQRIPKRQLDALYDDDSDISYQSHI